MVFMRGVPPRAPRLKFLFRGVPPRAPPLKAPLLLLVWGLPHRVVAPRQEPKIPRSYTRIFRLDGTLVLVRDSHDARSGDRFWTGADLVVEVVSLDNPEREFLQKREDYAEAGIPEYWIVDARSESITVLHLQGAAYVEHGLFQRHEHATSTILDAFGVDVGQVFDRNAD